MQLLQLQTKNGKQTQKAAQIFAKEVLNTSTGDRAFVIGLEGNLGGGKTTFTKGFAKGLGIKEIIQSPTFVLLKIFKIPSPTRKSEFRIGRYKYFIHIDAYRIKNAKEIKDLGWKDFLSDAKNIIVIEWSNKIKPILPKKYFNIKFEVIGENERKIIFKLT